MDINKALKEGTGIIMVSVDDLANLFKQVVKDNQLDLTESDRLLDIAEVARIFATTEKTIRDWKNSGYISLVKVGGKFKCSVREVKRLLNGGEK